MEDIDLIWTGLHSAELTQAPESGGDSTDAAAIDGLGGRDVVGLRGDAVGLGDCSKDLLGSEGQLYYAGFYHGLSLIHRSRFRNHLINKNTIKSEVI